MGVINSQFNPDFVDARVVLTNVDCNSSVYIGAVVIMVSGTAINALADSLTNSNMIGIVESKISLNKCNIRVQGTTEGDIFSGLDESKEYYLSDAIAGAISDLPPTASGSVILRIGQPFDDGNMVVLKGQRTVRL